MSDTHPIKIILVEDDTDLRESLVDCLELQGYALVGVANALSFYQAISGDIFDIAVIDIGLPDQSGLEIVSHVKKNNRMGIVVLTAMGSPEFRIKGYECGADLYLTKPTECKELAAAIANLADRLDKNASPPHVSQCMLWTLDITELHLTPPEGNQIILTERETLFMKLLMTRPGQKIRRLMACQALDCAPNDSHDRRMDSMVRRLRQKIKDTSGLELPIQTIYGKGYIFSSRAVVL
jgi:two-component system, OmpR family, response regulator